MLFSSLSSGSKQNCFYVEAKDSAILVDAGLSWRNLDNFVRQIGTDLSKLKAIFITHEHTDHVRGLQQYLKRLDVPVYIHPASAERLEFPLTGFRELEAGKTVGIDGLGITPFVVCHDAANTFGFMVSAKKRHLFLASDVGSFDSSLMNLSRDAHLIALEANYDPAMLAESFYPRQVRERIAGPYGHLSNEESVWFLDQVLGGKAANVVFLHLSQNNNTPDKLKELVLRKLRQKYDKVLFRIAKRENPLSLVEV